MIPTDPKLWAICYANVEANNPNRTEEELHELTAKKYEYEFLETLHDGEPYRTDICKTLDAFFKRKFNEEQRRNW